MRRERHPALYKWLLAGCVALLALASVVEVAHFHRDARTSKSCAICVLHHNTATPAFAAYVAPRLEFVTVRATFKVLPAIRISEDSFFIRPPPAV